MNKFIISLCSINGKANFSIDKTLSKIPEIFVTIYSSINKKSPGFTH